MVRQRQQLIHDDGNKNKTEFEKPGLFCSGLTGEKIHQVGKLIHLKDHIYPQENHVYNSSKNNPGVHDLHRNDLFLRS